MDARADGRGNGLEAGEPVRVGGCVGGGSGRVLPTEADIRQSEIQHALWSIEDALILLDGRPAASIEAAALGRIRDDLAFVLRNLKPHASR